MVEHIWPGPYHGGERAIGTPKIGNQDLNPDPGNAPPYLRDSLREVPCAAVGKVIASDRCYDHEAKSHRLHRLSHPAGLLGFWRSHRPMGYRAKSAVPRATIPQDEEGRGTARKTLPEIGAKGFLTDRMKLTPLENPVHFVIDSPPGNPPLQPRWLSQRRPLLMP
jgi:hypothetical protein